MRSVNSVNIIVVVLNFAGVATPKTPLNTALCIQEREINTKMFYVIRTPLCTKVRSRGSAVTVAETRMLKSIGPTSHAAKAAADITMSPYQSVCPCKNAIPMLSFTFVLRHSKISTQSAIAYIMPLFVP